MAIHNRLYNDLKVCQPFLVDVVGRVAIGASGAVGTAKGKGFTVTRTGTGLYTITLASVGAVPDILAAFADVVWTTGSATQMAQILTLDATNKKVTLQTSAAGTPNTAADPPSGASLQFRITVQNASVTG